MESLFFLEEQIQNGLSFRLGQPAEGGDFLRWEPVVAKLKGNEAVFFRESIALRKNIFSRPGAVAGILPFSGPVAFQGKIWLGLEARGGKSAFEMGQNHIAVAQLVRGLFPLINSYAACHEKGFSAGRPDWGRFLYDERGFYMPDPFGGPFLLSPPCHPPEGFTACYPPEIYRGEKYRPASDLFFLGLMLYYALTGALPYRLRKGWPNDGVLAGAVIPPAFYRPELNPKLINVMVDLLAVDPAKRPSASWVAEVWEGIIKAEEFTVSKAEAATGIKVGRRLWRRKKLKRMMRNFGAFLKKRAWMPFVVLALVLFISWGLAGPKPAPLALEFARNFYEKAAVMSVPVLRDMVGEPEVLLKDFELARKERLKLAAEVLSRPLAQVDRMRVTEAGPKQVKIGVNLTWWNWEGVGWKRIKKREVLVMERVKGTWRVRERNGIAPQ
ncbi:MAG: hypothetical protein K6U80_04535 [Firmicutes bacterium]|nr:hypothetical protein [Bacillota bacterium]